MDFMEALQLFGAGRERRIYAIPPYTSVKSLDFEDHPFEIQTWDERCDICGSNNSYLDEIIVNDKGEKKFICSDTNYCEKNIKT
jgi:alpha-D-ribose 1-methylphosphonate 5-phosphate C-P lyase